MKYEDEIIRKVQQEGDPELRRRRHYLKMGVAGGVMGICFGLFAVGVLGGKQAVARAPVKGRASRPDAVRFLAKVSGPEMGALVLGGVSAIWLLVLTLRLHRLE
jgi:hypothetical protein